MDKLYPDSTITSSNEQANSCSITDSANFTAQIIHFLDRPIAFHRCFASITGSITAALMLSQALYWQRRCKHPEGWWYKTRDDWFEETGLNRREQEIARRKLKVLGILEERLTGVPAKLWYRIGLDALQNLLLGVTKSVTLEEVIEIQSKDLVQLSKVGLMRAKRLGAVSEYVDYAQVLKQKGLTCNVCHQSITKGIGKKVDHLSFDHIVPLAKGGTHTFDNLHPCHAGCNSRKGDTDGQVSLDADRLDCLPKANQSAYIKPSSLSTLDQQAGLHKANKLVSSKPSTPFNTETTTEISPETTTTTTTTPARNKPALHDGNGCSSGCSQRELIFDFHLAGSSQQEKERATKLLEGLDSTTAQQVLDEFNEALGNGTIKKSRWGWLRQVAHTAREGTFQPTADLSERRREQHQAIAAQPPTRKPSRVWEEHRGDLLHSGVEPTDYVTYIAPLRGREDSQALWLEAPNNFVMDWVLAHLSQIEQTLKAYTVFPVRVCIG